MAKFAATRSAGRLHPGPRAATATSSHSRWELRPSPSSRTSPASPGSAAPGRAFLVYLFVIAFLTVTAGIYFTPGAASASRPQCNNRIDDDGDGKIDYPIDAGCTGKGDKSEVDPVQPPPPPPPPGYPDASTTGPSGVLAESFGNVTVNTPGTVIENRKINGCVIVQTSGVTIRNSHIKCQGWVVNTVHGSAANVLVEDSLLECSKHAGDAGITNKNYVLRRSEVIGCVDGAWCDINVTVQDSFIHDMMPYDPVTDPHTDAVQLRSGASNCHVRHNRIEGGYIDQTNFGSAAVAHGGNISNASVDDNILSGGGYTLYCEQEELGGDGSPQPTYTNNRFSTHFRPQVGGFGISTRCSNDIQSGNVIHETGQPLHLG